MEKKIKEIKNITCDVHNCVYNDSEGSKCMAGSIKVGCSDACCCGDTLCATFKLDETAL